MKKLLTSVICLALTLCCVAFSFGCGKGKLKGKWVYEAGGIEIYAFEFTDDKVIEYAAGQKILEADYTTDGDKIKITYTVLDQEFSDEWTYSIDGKKLTITISATGSPIVCTKK